MVWWILSLEDCLYGLQNFFYLSETLFDPIDAYILMPHRGFIPKHEKNLGITL